MSEVKKPGMKMKVTGYACIVFAALIALAMLFTLAESDPGMSIMNAWMILGTSLLFGNAGKRIGGAVVANRSPVVSHGQ